MSRTSVPESILHCAVTVQKSRKEIFVNNLRMTAVAISTWEVHNSRAKYIGGLDGAANDGAAETFERQ